MTWRDAGYAAAPAFFYILLSNILYSLIHMVSLSAGLELPGLLLQAVVSAICLAVFGVRAVSEKLFRKMEHKVAVRYPAAFCYCVAGIMCSVCCNKLLALSKLEEKSEGYRHVSDLFYGNGLLLEIFALCVLSPLVEEIVYRGFVYSRFRQKLGGVAAAAATALLFGVSHFNLVQGIYASVLGFVLGIFVWKTGSLYLAVAAHMAINLVSVLWTETDWLDFLNRDGAGAFVAAASALLMAIFFGYGNRLLRSSRKS